VIWFQIKVESRKEAMDKMVHGIQPCFWAERQYARQKIHTEAWPARLPEADRAANAAPYCMARKTDIGAEVSGKPINRPLTVGPHLRPARVTIPIKKGVTINLKARIISCNACKYPC
jgi:hypothetical protein